jgi:hypothetical protein
LPVCWCDQTAVGLPVCWCDQTLIEDKDSLK